MKKTITAILLSLLLAACATESTTRGAAWGAGIGALVGGVYGGHGSDALIGAAVGAGIGYVVGNEQDKKKAQQMSDASRPSYAHSETGPFGGTRWRLADWTPKDPKADFRSKTFEFGRDGWVKTTTIYNDGRTGTDTENYRVNGTTLIVNKGDYLVNYKFMLKGDELAVDTSKVRVLLKRF